MAERMAGSLNWGLARANSSSCGHSRLRVFSQKSLRAADGLSAGLAGDLLDRFEVNAVLADLFSREQLGRSVIVKLAELADTSVVSLFGAWAGGQEFEVIGEGF